MVNKLNWKSIGMSKKEMWDLISPWVHSTWISSVATFALLLVFIFFPGIKGYITVGDDSWFYIPFIGACAPFEGTPLTLVIWASFIYCGVGLGLILLKRHFLMANGYGWRSVISNFFLPVAIATFFLTIPLFSVIWALAFKDWNIAIGVWSCWGGNHGPWYRLYHLRRLLSHVFFLPYSSFYFALLSLVFKPNILATMVIFGSGILWLVLLFTHYWLID